MTKKSVSNRRPMKKPVFSRKIAHALCEEGFQVIDVQPNNNKPWLNVYYFEATPDLLDAFDEILTSPWKLR